MVDDELLKGWQKIYLMCTLYWAPHCLFEEHIAFNFPFPGMKGGSTRNSSSATSTTSWKRTSPPNVEKMFFSIKQSQQLECVDWSTKKKWRTLICRGTNNTHNRRESPAVKMNLMLNVSLLLKVLTTPPNLWLQQLPLILSVLSVSASETHSLKLVFAFSKCFCHHVAFLWVPFWFSIRGGGRYLPALLNQLQRILKVIFDCCLEFLRH